MEFGTHLLGRDFPQVEKLWRTLWPENLLIEFYFSMENVALKVSWCLENAESLSCCDG